ncbi:Mg2+ transporter protein [Mycena kentingensis (nom. inval.)]|nr:Mg2+ transporter protein [Mycena kentingensis (nom. inval.)]
MRPSTTALFTLLSVGASLAAPVTKRVTLDPVATAEAQQRDDTATRAASSVPIKTSDGQCLEVVSGTGDFRENLVPIKVAACSGAPGQQWDVITAGKHNDRAGSALIVSSLIQGCMNFDPRRAAGNQVILFSCGGRADGEGLVTDSQLFAFDGNLAGIILEPENSQGTCLGVTNGNLDQQQCNNGASQVFSIGDGGAAPPPADTASTPDAPETTTAAAPPAPTVGTTKLDQAATEEAQQRDDTATRAFSDVALKTSDGQCLEVVSGTGDFRENLVPINVVPCNGGAGQKFDVITAGKHNDRPGTALFVSSLIQGCMNFDPRRAPGNQVLLFSCGGRADGEGSVTDSQLFAFDGSKSFTLEPENAAGTCLGATGGKLDQQQCNNGAAQVFTIA